MKKIFFAVLLAAVAAQANLPEGFQADVKNNYPMTDNHSRTWQTNLGKFKDYVYEDSNVTKLVKKNTNKNYSSFLGTREKVEKGRSFGSYVLSLASDYDHGKYNDLFDSLAPFIWKADIKWPKNGYDFKGCDENTLAFVILKGGKPLQTIYLCANAIENYSAGKSMAQILIHETAHLAGFSDECDATTIEVGAMLFSGEGLAFRNAYMEKCGY